MVVGSKDEWKDKILRQHKKDLWYSSETFLKFALYQGRKKAKQQVVFISY